MKFRGLGASISHLPTYDDVGTPTVIGSLTSIGEIAPTADELDSTCLDSTGGYREFVAGFKDGGELALTGYHDGTDAGQILCRTLFGSGANGYFWVKFSDGSEVIFTGYVKGYSAGSADVDGLVGFAASIRVTGLVNVVAIAPAIDQSVAENATPTLVSTAYPTSGTVTYQWKTCDDLAYTNPANVVGGSGATSASYTTAALTPAGTKYFFCEITVSGDYRPINSQIHVVTVA
jgi:predicted secreted protein